MSAAVQALRQCSFSGAPVSLSPYDSLCVSSRHRNTNVMALNRARLLILQERLSAALVRPGRVDVKLWFASATRAQARAFFASFYQV